MSIIRAGITGVGLMSWVAVHPVVAMAPMYYTPERSIPYLVAYSARVHHVPVKYALQRSWEESNWRNVVSPDGLNFGPMQVNRCCVPGIVSMNVNDRIDQGMTILAYCRRVCHDDETCSTYVYRTGHLKRDEEESSIE